MILVCACDATRIETDRRSPQGRQHRVSVRALDLHSQAIEDRPSHQSFRDVMDACTPTAAGGIPRSTAVAERDPAGRVLRGVETEVLVDLQLLLVKHAHLSSVRVSVY